MTKICFCTLAHSHQYLSEDFAKNSEKIRTSSWSSMDNCSLGRLPHARFAHSQGPIDPGSIRESPSDSADWRKGWRSETVRYTHLVCHDNSELTLKLKKLVRRDSYKYYNYCLLDVGYFRIIFIFFILRLPLLHSAASVLLHSKMFYVPFLICKTPQRLPDLWSPCLFSPAKE